MSRRVELETKIQADLAKQDFPSKATFDEVTRWGFGTESGCDDNEIQRATELAFRALKLDRISEAARTLVELPKIGISRASKILALSDQNELGIYDSRSAHGLSDLVDTLGKRIIPIPPGRVISGDNLNKIEFCGAFERYTWVLRALRRLAGTDEILRTAFPRVADLEIAFFTRSKIGEMRAEPRRTVVPDHLQKDAEADEESLFWTLGPSGKQKAFWVIRDGNSSVTVLTGNKKTPLTLRSEQIRECLQHFGADWFPLSNSKTAEDRNPQGLGEYFARNFDSSVFASHFAALWCYQGLLISRFKHGWWFKVVGA